MGGGDGCTMLTSSQVAAGEVRGGARPQVESTFAMQKIQPKVKAIQDKYKGDQTKAQTEVARLYQEAQVPGPPSPRPRPPPPRVHAASCTMPPAEPLRKFDVARLQSAVPGVANCKACWLLSDNSVYSICARVKYCRAQWRLEVCPPVLFGQ